MSGILDIDGMTAKQRSQRNATDSEGRKLSHNATVQDVHDIVIQECAKVHEFYLQQIPHFTARMIQDALMSYGLVAPQSPVAGGDTAAPDTTAPLRLHASGCAATQPGGRDCDCTSEPAA